MKIAKLKLLPGIMLAVAALLAITVGPVMAQPPVTSPFSGDVTIDGAPAPNGSDVAAYVGAETAPRATTTITTVGQYGLALIGTAGDVGKSVSFKVKKAGTGVWLDATTAPPNPTFANYDPQVVDLFATSPALPTVAFSSDSYTVGEGGGTATITVALSAASTTTVTVDYATSDGTATEPDDYTAASGTLTFTPGDTSKSFTVTIIDDALVESDETVNLALSSPSNATLGTPNTAVLTIVDNDAAPVAPTAEFSATPRSGTAPLFVQFTDESTGDITGWSWTFGDGGTSTERSPSHTYTDVGTYDVSLEVTGPAGSDTETKLDYITVSAGVETATGTGTATFSSDEGSVTDLAAVDEATLPEEGKPDIEFPHGFFSFSISGITPGSSVTVTITLPSDMPTNTQYWKYHDPEGWVDVTSLLGDNDGDNVLTLTLTDGGLGDDDGLANGTIVDAGGPGNPPPPPPGVGGTAYPINKLAILAPWIALGLAVIVGATIFARRRRARS